MHASLAWPGLRIRTLTWRPATSVHSAINQGRLWHAQRGTGPDYVLDSLPLRLCGSLPGSPLHVFRLRLPLSVLESGCCDQVLTSSHL